MLTIKVWCLPGDMVEGVYQALHKKLVASMVEIKHLNVRDENDLLVLFPKDLMQYGLGNEILIEFGGTKELEGSDNRWNVVVGERLAFAVKSMFPTAKLFFRPDLARVDKYEY